MWKIILFRIIHARSQVTKFFIEPCLFPEKYTQNITFVNYYQLGVDYESNKHTLQILKNRIEVLVTPVPIESLCLTPSQVQVKLLYPLKHKLTQNVHAQLYSTFLFSYIIITQLLSPCLKNELHLLSVSEIGKFNILALNFGGWPFSITVTRFFRPKSDHSNEKVYLKPIDRRLKKLPNEGSDSFLRLTTPELWKFF